MAKNAEDDVKTGKIRLTQPHTHEGVEYAPGEVLELREDQVAWLIEQGRGEKVAKREPAANDPASGDATQPGEPTDGG